MKIFTENDYREALQRVHILRAKGRTAENHAELAEVEGAIAAYEALPDQPGVSKGRPS